MIRFTRLIRDLRLIPIVLIASACLLVLKTADFLLDRGYLTTADRARAEDADATVIHAAPDVPQPGETQQSWAQQMFNFPGPSGAPPAASATPPLPAIASLAADDRDADITGSIATDKTKAKGEAGAAPGKDGKNGKGSRDSKKAKDSTATDGKDVTPASGTVILSNGSPLPSGAERTILERLQQRRQELDKRARELDIREGLIQAVEKRVDGKLAAIKEAQAQLGAATEKRDEAEAARFKGLVTMYENMKPRDAAKIFDHLEIAVLLEVASQINPRKMSDILAQMSPEAAERLTVELASRAQTVAKSGADELPKIEGRPTTP